MNFQREIKDAVITEVPLVQSKDNLKVAIREMSAGKTSAVIVVNNEELVGIISDMDIAHVISNGGDIDKVEVANAMTACQLISEKGAVTPCVQLDEDESVASALQIMNETGVHHLLVSGSEDTVTGLVTARDLLELAAL
jgi:CBS domain-containing protein